MTLRGRGTPLPFFTGAVMEVGFRGFLVGAVSLYVSLESEL